MREPFCQLSAELVTDAQPVQQEQQPFQVLLAIQDSGSPTRELLPVSFATQVTTVTRMV